MNKVVHFELPFDDKERVSDFYKNVFDWQLDDMPSMNYTIARSVEVDENQMIKEPGAINGGMYKREEGLPTGPVLVINVPSVDGYVAKVAEAGGEVYKEKMKVGEMGYYAYVKDPEGNIIGIWENIEK